MPRLRRKLLLSDDHLEIGGATRGKAVRFNVPITPQAAYAFCMLDLGPRKRGSY